VEEKGFKVMVRSTRKMIYIPQVCCISPYYGLKNVILFKTKFGGYRVQGLDIQSGNPIMTRISENALKENIRSGYITLRKPGEE